MTTSYRIALGTFAAIAIAATASPAPVSAQALRSIYVRNDCYRPIELFVRHADEYRSWHQHGWFRLRPYRGTYLSANGARVRQLENHRLYFYAQTTDGGRTNYWQGGRNDSLISFRGAAYRIRRALYSINARGDYQFRITCRN